MIEEGQQQALQQFAGFGFSLEQEGSVTIELRHEGEHVCRFMQSAARPENIQMECSRHLVMEHHWDCCLWKAKETSQKK